MTSPLDIIQTDPVKVTVKEVSTNPVGYENGMIVNVHVTPTDSQRIGYRVKGRIYYLDQSHHVFIPGSIASLLMINPSFLHRVSTGEIEIVTHDAPDQDDSDDMIPDVTEEME